MSTVRESRSLAVSAVHAESSSLRTRIADAVKAVWKRLAPSVPIAPYAEIRMACSPVIAKIPAICVAGEHARQMRKALPRMAPSMNTKLARRPGVQGRWKTSDRVPML